MSCELHLLLVFKLILEVLITFEINQLSALEHTIRQSLVVSSTDHVDLWVDVSALDHLEIVWEVASEIDLLVAERF